MPPQPMSAAASSTIIPEKRAATLPAGLLLGGARRSMAPRFTGTNPGHKEAGQVQFSGGYILRSVG